VTGPTPYIRCVLSNKLLPLDAEQAHLTAMAACSRLPATGLHSSADESSPRRWEPIVFYGEWVLWKVKGEGVYMLLPIRPQEGQRVEILTFDPSVGLSGRQRERQTSKAFDLLLSQSTLEVS
jgi:hypothetical protein